MLFNSIDFLMFFPLTVAVYFIVPTRLRWIWLLGASYWFYGSWRVEFLVLIWASTLVDYIAGRLLGATTSTYRRRFILGLSLVTNFGILFVFKYLSFAIDSTVGLLEFMGFSVSLPHPEVVLPVGLSFYTFQSISYTIDVFRGRLRPEPHLGRFALYVAFFPQLVAGPIERAQHLLPQFRQRHPLDFARIESGLRLMGWGLFKKVVVADHLAVAVDRVYSDPTVYTGVPLVLATYAFAWQIYCDFSAYSDIAIGAARVMGFDLMLNFDRPYAALSVREFWQRWHISLSTWFRDYLYIPLGGNRVSISRWCVNLMVTFLLSGLWHGANWTFVLWGGLHGLYMIVAAWISIIARRYRTGSDSEEQPWSRLVRPARQVVTFHLVLLAWIFFRADTVEDAWYIIANVGREWVLSTSYNIGLGPSGFAIALAGIAIVEVVHYVHSKVGGLGRLLDSRPTWNRWAVYYMLIFAILMFGRFDNTEFIYFQF